MIPIESMISVELPRQVNRRKNKLDQMIFSSRIRLTRNLESLKFPAMLMEEKKYMIDEKISDYIKVLSQSIRIENLEHMTTDRVMNLVGSQVLTQEFVKNGRKFACEMNGEWVILINEEDHLKIFSTETGFNLRKMYLKISEVLRQMEQSVDFAFDERWGYLTSSISNMGTGLRFSVLANLYGLVASKQIQSFVDMASGIGYSVNSVGGDESDSALFYISNTFSLGLSEEEMIAEFEQLLLRLYTLEMECRAEVFSGNDEREIAYEEIVELNCRNRISWTEMLYYTALIDAMNKKYLHLDDIQELRDLVYQGTDVYLRYKRSIEIDRVENVRMDYLKRLLMKIKYRSTN